MPTWKIRAIVARKIHFSTSENTFSCSHLAALIIKRKFFGFFFVFIANGFKAKQKISFLVSLWVIKWIYEGFYEFRFVLMWRDNNFGLDCC